MHPCPDCAGCGVVHTSTIASTGVDMISWCRACSGSGLARVPEEDDEHHDITLLWPESIRWQQSA